MLLVVLFVVGMWCVCGVEAQQTKEMIEASAATLLLADTHTIKELRKLVHLNDAWAPSLRGGLCKVWVYVYIYTYIYIHTHICIFVNR